MSQPTTPYTKPTTHAPVRNLNSRQLRAVRKELLILRADVERAEFAQARRDLRQTLASFSWLKLFLPGLGSPRARGTDRGINAAITEWIAHHPLASSLGSVVLAGPLRATLGAGAKPLLKWASIGAAAWAGYRFVAQALHHETSGTETHEGEPPAAS